MSLDYGDKSQEAERERQRSGRSGRERQQTEPSPHSGPSSARQYNALRDRQERRRLRMIEIHDEVDSLQGTIDELMDELWDIFEAEQNDVAGRL